MMDLDPRFPILDWVTDANKNINKYPIAKNIINKRFKTKIPLEMSNSGSNFHFNKWGKKPFGYALCNKPDHRIQIDSNVSFIVKNVNIKYSPGLSGISPNLKINIEIIDDINITEDNHIYERAYNNITNKYDDWNLTTIKNCKTQVPLSVHLKKHNTIPTTGITATINYNILLEIPGWFKPSCAHNEYNINTDNVEYIENMYQT